MILKKAACALPDEDFLRKMDVRIRGDKIAGIASDFEPEDGEEVIDVGALEMYPGAIDPHVHFDEPGFTHREDFFHGSMAAARGGITTVIDMPCTSLPPVTTLENLKVKLAVISGRSVVDFALFGGVSGDRIESALSKDMADLAPFVVGYKCYFISGMESFTEVDHFGFSRALAKAASLGRPLLLHAEDPGIVYPATGYLKAQATKEGRQPSWNDYCDSRPELAESVAAAEALALAGKHAPKLHIVHVGTSEVVDLLGYGLDGMDRGATCETCPHYLEFSKEDFVSKKSALKTAPPVKSRGQAARLWEQLADGAITFVASDHAPAPEAEKTTGSPWSDYGGIPGTGTLFPYLYSEGFRKNRLSLKVFLRVTSGAAAERYGLSGAKGSIRVGKDADLVLMDPRGEYKVSGKNLLSKGTITPFEGMKLSGSVRMTLVRGRMVWMASEAERVGVPQSGICVTAGYGKQVVWGCS